MERIIQMLPPCLFHHLTGLYCPGCGGTRAVLALFSGNFRQSFYYHPIVLYLVVCLAWYLVMQLIRKITKGRCTVFMPESKILIQLAATVVIINFLLRNLLYIGWGITL